MKKRSERIIFYSKEDGAVPHHLSNIEEFLKNLDINGEFCINDFLEFYSIKQHFDENLFLDNWEDDLKNDYVKISEILFKKTSKYFCVYINNINFIGIINNLEFHYTKIFYYLFDYFKIYKKIDGDIICNILEKKPYFIKYILEYKNTIKHYDGKIKAFLQSYNKSVELFLEHLEENKFNFPQSLTDMEKENIVIKYLEKTGSESMRNSEHISKLKNNDFLRLSNKTKLLAKKKHKEFVEEFFKDNTNTLKHSCTVGLSKTQKQDVLIENLNPLEPIITYSINLFNSLYENKGISYLFRNIFEYIDNRGNINLVSQDSEISSLMELFSSNIPGEYKESPTFSFNENLSILNLITLINYYENNHNKKISSIINYFISNLQQYNGFENIIFRTKSLDIIKDYADILKIIIPEFDLLVKQFICHIKEGSIDFELIGMQDGFDYSNIPSFLDKKYFYEKNNKLKDLKFYFFSDQSGLFYIKGYERKYNNFYELIKIENLKFENFHKFQIDTLQFLIKENILYLDGEKYIRIKNKVFIFLIGEIYKKGVISYFGYKDLIKKEIIKMEDLGYLYFESKLLSHLESGYFNYYLNNKEFSNSQGIRNKNMHGFYYLDKNQEYNDYLVVIKLIILMFIKIEDELNIKEKK